MQHGERETLERALSSLRRQVTELRRRLHGAHIEDPLPEGGVPLLLLRVGSERMGVPLSLIERVVPIAATTPIPEASPWVLGVLNLAGAPVPVIDVLARVEGRAPEIALSDMILIMQRGERRYGLSVQEIYQVDEATVTGGAQELGELPHAAYLRGVAHVGSDPVLVLSLEKLIETTEFDDEVAP